MEREIKKKTVLKTEFLPYSGDGLERKKVKNVAVRIMLNITPI